MQADPQLLVLAVVVGPVVAAVVVVLVVVVVIFANRNLPNSDCQSRSFVNLRVCMRHYTVRPVCCNTALT